MPNQLEEGQQPYESSGYLMDETQALEVTLCHSPAVVGAKFVVVRNQNGNNHGMKLQMPAKANKVKRQVMGYVSIPWIEDFFGDVMDPTSIEHAANSMLHNMQTGNIFGNGVGEEHYAFWDNAHIIQSVVDYNGGIGGVPGGWWIAIQVTDPDTWDKVVSGQYTGFSLGSHVRYVNTKSERVRQAIFDKIPDLKAASSTKPSKGKPGMFTHPGTYGYPEEQSAYADPANYKYPVDTRSRAYATLRYVLDNYDSEGYSIDELKYVVRRMLAAIGTHGDEVPKEVRERVGFTSKQSVLDFASECEMKFQAAPTSSSEEANAMNGTNSLPPEMLTAIQQATQTAVAEATKAQSAQLEEIKKMLGGQHSTQSAPQMGQPNAQQSAEGAGGADAGKDGQGKGAEGEAKQSITLDDLRAAIREELKGQATQAGGQDASTPQTPQGNTQPAQQTAPTAPAPSQPNPAPAAPAATPAQQSQDPNAPVTVGMLQQTIAGLGQTLAQTVAQAVAQGTQGTVNAVQSVAEHIAEMPMPRATQLKTMTTDQRSAFIEEMKRKIQSGADFTAEEGRMAEQLGMNFDSDDPTLGL